MDKSMDTADLNPLNQELMRMSSALEVMRAVSAQESEHNKASMIRFQATLETMVGKLDGLQVIASRMETHDDSLRRAWTHIKDQDKRLDDSERKSSRATGMALGFAAMASALVALICYLYTQDRAQEAEDSSAQQRTTEQIGERMQRVEIYLAGPKSQPYQR